MLQQNCFVESFCVVKVHPTDLIPIEIIILSFELTAERLLSITLKQRSCYLTTIFIFCSVFYC